METKRVLIIDDEEDVCNIVKMNLELRGDLLVVTATNGEDGLKLALYAKPHLILLDISMPDMDGLQVLERLKADIGTRTIPVVMLTAKKDFESKFKAGAL